MLVSQQTKHAYQFGPFQLVPEERLLLRNGGAVALSPKDMDLLLVLVESRGRLLQKDELMKHLWPESFVEEANLSHHVFRLRKALNDHGDEVIYIETVPKHGYRFVAPVREVREEEEAATITRRQSSSSGDGHAEENLSQIPDRLTSDSEGKLGISPKPASQETLANQESLARRRWPAGVFALFLLAVFLAALAMMLIPTQGRWWGSQEQMPTTLPSIQSLAVLPFTNTSGDPTNEYLSDGITESLINRLSRLPRLRVVARTSAFRYKSQQVDPRTVGRQLQVSAMVTGRVSQRGDSLNIQVDLVDTTDGSQLWGEQYSRKMTDILAVQTEIAAEISNKLRLRLTPEQQMRLTHGYTENSEAYQAYIRGRYFWNKRTQAGMTKGIEYFQQAVEKDPGYALAYVGLADCYLMLGSYSYLSPNETFPKATAIVAQAIQLDDSLAEGHATWGYIMSGYNWDFTGAEREFKRALELNPSSAICHQWYAHNLNLVGRQSEAIEEMKRAVALDPLSLAANTGLGYQLYLSRLYDQAIEQCRKVIEMDPGFPWGHLRLGMAYQQKGMVKEAIAEFRKASSEDSSEAIAALGHAYGIAGKRDEARQIIIQLTQPSKQPSKLRYISPYDVAVAYTGLGEGDNALLWLEKAYEEHAWSCVKMITEPRLDSLRSTPRFQSLIGRILGPTDSSGAVRQSK